MTQTPDENDPDIPTLTRRTDSGSANMSTTLRQPEPSPAGATRARAPLSSAILQTLLQVEIERAVNRSIDEAMDSVRLRLEREIPAIIERTLKRVGQDYE